MNVRSQIVEMAKAYARMAHGYARHTLRLLHGVWEVLRFLAAGVLVVDDVRYSGLRDLAPDWYLPVTFRP